MNKKAAASVIVGSMLILPLTASADDHEDGFIEGSHLNILARNYYFNRNNKDGRNDAKDWSQALLLRYQSGFTEGTIGLGLNALAFTGVKLDASSGKTGTDNLRVHDDGHPSDTFSKAGAALKLRWSNSTLVFGDQEPFNPVFATGHNRLVAQTAKGLSLDIREFENLNIEAGHFTGATGTTSTNTDGELWALFAGVSTPSVDYIGATYTLSPGTVTKLYVSHFEDLWHQYYFNLGKKIELKNNHSLNFDFNLYRTLDTGSANAGSINNTTWGLSAAYAFGAHTITLAAQKVDGDIPFDYLGTGDVDRYGFNRPAQGGSIFLPNSVQYSDFNGPNERSWQLRYDISMEEFNLPGLSFMTRYIRGSGIDGTHVPANSPYANIWGENAKHHELNVEARYVVQSGPMKDLSFRLRQTWHRANHAQPEGNMNEFRLITDYPIDVF
ncbi:OprD family porin [Ectopseudomonas mendocina]|uniref:OprD family porin n=1 Tax=Ectopseudomonas mendocina TaxID=300 RepID=A0ABZ2RLJ2_ECTME